jgi:hypothetical protein
MSSWLGARNRLKNTSCARSGTSASFGTRTRKKRFRRPLYLSAMPATNRYLLDSLNEFSVAESCPSRVELFSPQKVYDHLYESP